jgi:hypothetical protein
MCVYLRFQLHVRKLQALTASQCVGRGKSINPNAGAFERRRKAVQSKVMGMGGDTNSFVFVFR